MKFVNFFASTEHYFCVAVNSTANNDIQYANVNMRPVGTYHVRWEFNEWRAIGADGAHYSGKEYVANGSYKNALNALNSQRTKEYTSLAQHFADMYL